MMAACWLAAGCLAGSISASRNFLAQVRKFKIAGIQSEATTIAATIWPSSGACTVAEFSTFELGCGCGFWLNASNFAFAYLCKEIPTRGDAPSQAPAASQQAAIMGQGTALQHSSQKIQKSKLWGRQKSKKTNFGIGSYGGPGPREVYLAKFVFLDFLIFGTLVFWNFGGLVFWILGYELYILL